MRWHVRDCHIPLEGLSINVCKRSTTAKSDGRVAWRKERIHLMGWAWLTAFFKERGWRACLATGTHHHSTRRVIQPFFSFCLAALMAEGTAYEPRHFFWGKEVSRLEVSYG